MWVNDLEDRWRRDNDYAAMWRYVLKLCDDVAVDDTHTIGMIGAGPLENLVVRWPDEALPAIDIEVANNRVLLEALATTWTQGLAIRDRIDAILERHDQDRL